MVGVHSNPQQSCISGAMGSTLHMNSHWCTDIGVVITGAFESDLSFDLSLHLPFYMMLYQNMAQKYHVLKSKKQNAKNTQMSTLERNFFGGRK